MTVPPIADSPAALTPEWLTAVLEAGGHLQSARVATVTARPLGTGQMCDSTGLLTEDRRAHEDGLVRGYHEALLAAGVTGYGWEDCWTDYRRGTFAGLLMAVGASMMVERTERGDEMFMAMAARHSQHVLDLDAPDLIAG